MRREERTNEAMDVLDYSRSFITFLSKEVANNARIQIEARCELTVDGIAEEYWLVASCKSEDTFAERNLFKVPNYDFCMIYSRDKYRMHRVPFPYDPSAMDAGPITERFVKVDFALKPVAAELCEDNEAAVAASLAGKILIGRTEIWNEDNTRRAVIEYPVKTMNAHEEPAYFQVDTGPILLPDFGSERPAIEAFELAFIAWNVPGWAEFVVQDAVPACPEMPDGPQVCHYSRIQVMDARNEIWAYD
jgi:hypothetical protein